MKPISSILLFFLWFQAHAQEFYITTYNYNNFLNKIKLVDADLNVTPLASFNFNGDQILDIAFAPDGTLYGTNSDAIIEIDLQNGTSSVVYEFPVPGQYNSLVCNSANEIVTLEYNTAHLITIDLATFTQVSDVVLAESSPGDLTFYRGNLIFQGTTSNNILRYNGTDLLRVACPMTLPSQEYALLLGFSNYTDQCESNFIYGFSQFGDVYHYDLTSNTAEYVGDLGNANDLVNGSASMNEYTASSCPVVDMDEVSCTVEVPEEQLPDIRLYPNPVLDILHIAGPGRLDKLLFTLCALDGRKLMEGNVPPEMDLTQLSPGIYVLDIHNTSKKNFTSRRIIKV